MTSTSGKKVQGRRAGKRGAEPGQLGLVPGAVAGMAVRPPSELQDVYELSHSDKKKLNTFESLLL